MKALSLSIYTVLLSFAFSSASAQVSASSEPRGQIDQSGEVIILPIQYSEPVAEVAEAKAPAEKIIRNVSQKRDAKLGKMRNGYYQLAGNHDWGTSIRLNSYGYVTTVTRAANPKLAEAALTQPALSGSIAHVTEHANRVGSEEGHFIAPGIIQRVAVK